MNPVSVGGRMHSGPVVVMHLVDPRWPGIAACTGLEWAPPRAEHLRFPRVTCVACRALALSPRTAGAEPPTAGQIALVEVSTG